jgi:hypothetical protein
MTVLAHTRNDEENDLSRLKVIFCAQFLTGRIAQMIQIFFLFGAKCFKLTMSCT